MSVSAQCQRDGGAAWITGCLSCLSPGAGLCCRGLRSCAEQLGVSTSTFAMSVSVAAVKRPGRSQITALPLYRAPACAGSPGPPALLPATPAANLKERVPAGERHVALRRRRKKRKKNKRKNHPAAGWHPGVPPPSWRLPGSRAVRLTKGWGAGAWSWHRGNQMALLWWDSSHQIYLQELSGHDGAGVFPPR